MNTGIFMSLLLGMMVLPLFGQVRQGEPRGLKKYQWQNRLLLVLAASRDNASFAEQLRLFQKEESASAERDLLLLEVVVEGPVEGKGGQSLWASSLRKTYKVKEQAFTLVLVGKDGGEKHGATAPTAPKTIYAIIDAMPIRRSEMRRKD